MSSCVIGACLRGCEAGRAARALTAFCMAVLHADAVSVFNGLAGSINHSGGYGVPSGCDWDAFHARNSASIVLRRITSSNPRLEWNAPASSMFHRYRRNARSISPPAAVAYVPNLDM